MAIKLKGRHSRSSLARFWQLAHERARLMGLGPIDAIEITAEDGHGVLTLSGGEDDLVALAATLYSNPMVRRLPGESALEADMKDATDAAAETDLTPSKLLEALESSDLPAEKPAVDPALLEAVKPLLADAVAEQATAKGASPKMVALMRQVIAQAVREQASKQGASPATAMILVVVAMLLFERVLIWLGG